MATAEAVRISKECDALKVNIDTNRLFEGQVTVKERYNKDTATLKVTIEPKDGNHCEGEYVFKIEMEGISGTEIYCQTAIYHPNINIITGKVCIDLEPDYSVQNVVEELLKLMRAPTFSESQIEIDSMDPTDFYADTKTSIAGGRVGKYLFPMNPRYAGLHSPANDGESTEVEGMFLVDRNFGIQEYIPRSTLDEEDDDEGNRDDDDDDDDDGGLHKKTSSEEDY